MTSRNSRISPFACRIASPSAYRSNRRPLDGCIVQVDTGDDGMSKDLHEMTEAKLPGDSVLRSGARPGLSTAAFPDGARIRRRSRLVCRNVADSQRQGDRSHDKAIGVRGVALSQCFGTADQPRIVLKASSRCLQSGGRAIRFTPSRPSRRIGNRTPSLQLEILSLVPHQGYIMRTVQGPLSHTVVSHPVQPHNLS